MPFFYEGDMTAKKPQAARKKMGAPSTYTDALAEKICGLIEEGYSERQISKMPGMPSARTMTRWKEDPDFCRQSARAREASAEKYDDERMEEVYDLKRTIALHIKLGKDLPKGYVEAKKLICQELARSAALRDDSRFGDRKTVAIDAKVDGAGLADVYAKIAEAVKGEQE